VSTFIDGGPSGSDRLVLGRLWVINSSYNLIPAAPSDVSSITRYLVDLSDGETVTDTSTLTVSDVILDALSVGTVWTLDDIGFNFVDQVPGDLLEDANGYEVQYVIVLADDTVVKPDPVELDMRPSN
jgi:hypothetical protein